MFFLCSLKERDNRTVLCNIEVCRTMMASTESDRNFVSGPAKRSEWAQMIRLGGDRVAVLLVGKVRESVDKVAEIIGHLPYLGTDGRYVHGTEPKRLNLELVNICTRRSFV